MSDIEWEIRAKERRLENKQLKKWVKRLYLFPQFSNDNYGSSILISNRF